MLDKPPVPNLPNIGSAEIDQPPVPKKEKMYSETWRVVCAEFLDVSMGIVLLTMFAFSFVGELFFNTDSLFSVLSFSVVWCVIFLNYLIFLGTLYILFGASLGEICFSLHIIETESARVPTKKQLILRALARAVCTVFIPFIYLRPLIVNDKRGSVEIFSHTKVYVRRSI